MSKKKKCLLLLALCNAVIIGCISFISQLLFYGYPPTKEAIYVSALTALLTFLVTLKGILTQIEEEVTRKPNPRPPILGMVI